MSFLVALLSKIISDLFGPVIMNLFTPKEIKVSYASNELAKIPSVDNSGDFESRWSELRNDKA